VVIEEVVTKLAGNVARTKHSVVTPYLFHLYHQHDLLDLAKFTKYDTGLRILEYDLTEEIPKEPREKKEEEEEVPKLNDKRQKSMDPGS